MHASQLSGLSQQQTTVAIEQQMVIIVSPVNEEVAFLQPCVISCAFQPGKLN